jgi:hypothetical protein
MAEADLERELADHESWLIQFGLSIAPAPGHLLDWARFMVKVEATDGAAVPSMRSLFPARPSRTNGRLPWRETSSLSHATQRHRLWRKSRRPRKKMLPLRTSFAPSFLSMRD